MSEKGLAVVYAESPYEVVELHYPRLRLIEEGYEVRIVGPEPGGKYKSHGGYPVNADCGFEDINAGEVKILIVPGGICPDRLRRYPACLKLTADVVAAGAVTGFICHAGWVAISAKVVKGKRMTSVLSIRDDMENAGANWVDEPCVVDGNMITAQVAKDVPEFMKAILKQAQSQR